jgi:cytidine deaminase
MKSFLTTAERERVVEAAREAAKSAYARYSRFRVGAAVLAGKTIYVGANVENASYGLSLCAERAALATAIAQGARAIRAIAVACIDAGPEQGPNELVPCGACRQWMVELAPEAEVILCGTDQTLIFSVEELMPIPFRLADRLDHSPV